MFQASVQKKEQFNGILTLDYPKFATHLISVCKCLCILHPFLITLNQNCTLKSITFLFVNKTCTQTLPSLTVNHLGVIPLVHDTAFNNSVYK